MNIGDYVRTDYGIGKIIEIFQSTDVDEPDLKLDVSDCNDNPYIFKSEVIKSSPNIIDLIEVGDYVNGSKVKIINNSSENPIYHFVIVDNASTTYSTIYKNEIRSILTKEQFETYVYEMPKE